jgi:hypothetical protein
VAVHPFHRIGSRERKPTGQHFVKRDAEGVKVAPRIDGAIHSSGLFWRHVRECSGDELRRFGPREARPDILEEAEATTISSLSIFFPSNEAFLACELRE